MKNKYDLLKQKLEKFNVNIEYEYSTEGDNNIINIKDNNNNLVSQLIVPGLSYSTENITFEKDGKTLGLDVFFDSYVLIIDFDSYKYSILENNKNINIEDSKFKNIYNFFDKKAYISLFHIFLLTELESVNFNKHSYPVSKILLRNNFQINESILEHL